jgi:Domain of unknown function (DUF3859)
LATIHLQRMQRLLLVCLAMLYALVASQAGVASEVSATITRHGETTTHRMTGSREAPGTLSGVVNLVEDVSLVRETQIICADLGRSFGVWLSIEAPAGQALPMEIDTVTEHPVMTAPDGRSSTAQRSTMLSLGTETYFGWSFDHTWEIVPGLWRFAFHHEGRLIAEKLFEVREEACYLGS